VALLEQGDIARKGQYISAAFNIVDSLRSSLDHQAGGEIADGLESIYDYVGRRLVEAHAQNDVSKMKEADRLLGEIEAAWLAIPAAG
ncbi:MAG TPA: flagellar export chaperone FliS, partial [Aquimonas sp.]|nr:flagellar export chaperone FliS [Aquimonas sp.]